MKSSKPKAPEKSQAEIDAEKEAERRAKESAALQARRDEQERRRGFGTGAFLRPADSIQPITKNVLGV